jgi:hypothetical protein
MYLNYLANEVTATPTFHHHSTFWKHLAKNGDGKDCLIEIWKYAKRFCQGHPKKKYDLKGIHLFPRCNKMHWYLWVVRFDSKTIYSIDSFGAIEHKLEMEQLLSFLRVLLMKDRPRTRAQSCHKTHEIDYMPDLTEWEYKVVNVPTHCRQYDGVSCGLFVCMFAASITDHPEVLWEYRKQFKKDNVGQELATLWRRYLFNIILLEGRPCPETIG